MSLVQAVLGVEWGGWPPARPWFEAEDRLKRAWGGLGAWRGGARGASKTGVVQYNADHGGGHVTAGPDALGSEDYAPSDDLLPDRGPATELGRDPDLRPPEPDAFARSRGLFEGLLGWLGSGEAEALTHGELEQRLTDDSRALFCQLFQDHLELRAARERRLEEVQGSDGVARRSADAGRARSLATVFGEVTVSRTAYRARGRANLHPADAHLNLPQERHSHGLRRWAACEAARGSFDDGCEAIERGTGQRLAKRQAEQLARRGAADFDAFYERRKPCAGDEGDALVISCDGKGVVMRPEALREATRKQAEGSQGKLKTRLSKGEKRNRKRIATVGAVYEATPVPRTATDVLPSATGEREAPKAAPEARGKWLTASVAEDAAELVGEVFDEACRRDPEHARDWLALVDGANHQIECIEDEARGRGVEVTVLCDFVHVLEYLWGAAWSLHREGDPAAEGWVRRHAEGVLSGRARTVAANIRREATKGGLSPPRRKGADVCARYLTNKAPYLDYPTALKRGWPIATGVIEGACRHLVKDRMDLTGARWGLDGAEAILKLRAIRVNGDFEEYWRFHLAEEHRRVHRSHYAEGVVPPTT
ncbi:MAG: ISKra4 family transposase [Actinobacteria bacterium]|nr:ISKra4 family transposase [Actinomycetota bacterium]